MNIRGSDGTKLVVALIDWENMENAAKDVNKTIDYKKLIKLLRGFGPLKLAMIFIPENQINKLPHNIELLGFRPIPCWRMKEGSEKIEDTVDINIIETGIEFCEFSEITDVIISSNDKHMVRLVPKIKNMGKTVHILGTLKISYVLRGILEKENIHENFPLK